MRKKHALINYSHYRDTELIAEGYKVVQDSTGNPHAAGSVPPVADVKTATEDFEKANTEAAGGDHVLVIAKAKARTKLETTLGKFAGFIDTVADGDIEIIEGCGLHSSAEPSHAEHDELELKHGEASGQIVARCKKDDVAGAYVFQYFYGLTPPTDDSQWNWKTVSLQIEATLTGLNKGDILIRYCAVTTEGMQPWSAHRHISVL